MDERIRHALLELSAPSAFFTSLPQQERSALRELYDLIGVPQSEKHHPEGDAFVHTMMVVDEAAKVRDRAQRPLDFMLAALTHDLGKKISTGRKENGDWHAIGHERTGLPLLERMLRRIGADEDTIRYCHNLCKLHMRVHTCHYGKAGVKATNRLFSECLCPQDLALLCLCDARGKGTGGDKAAYEEKTRAEETFIFERLDRYLQSIREERHHPQKEG